MCNGLNAVLAALDNVAAPVQFFLRDDDAGWDDAQLFALLDCTERAGVPIDLAVIPQATDAALARELRTRANAAPDLLGLHQHGFAHSNHEATGRKCEFGVSRELDAQRRDLILGREWLSECFGDRLDPIFTPPWNRCAPGTPALLAELGYAALSRDAGAEPQQAIAEIAVHVDWCKQRRTGATASDTAVDALPHAIAHHAANGTTVGLMLHHAQMNAEDLVLLGRWLASWTRHPHARWLPMRRLMYETVPKVLCC